MEGRVDEASWVDRRGVDHCCRCERRESSCGGGSRVAEEADGLGGMGGGPAWLLIRGVTEQWTGEYGWWPDLRSEIGMNAAQNARTTGAGRGGDSDAHAGAVGPSVIGPRPRLTHPRPTRPPRSVSTSDALRKRAPFHLRQIQSQILAPSDLFLPNHNPTPSAHAARPRPRPPTALRRAPTGIYRVPGMC